ncbi:MAG: histidine kinase [Pirellulales bacterium]
MVTLMLTGDLMIGSQAGGVASRCGVTLKAFASPDQLLAECGDGEIGQVLVDLAVSGLDLQSLIAALKQLPSPPTRVVAFGPHVQEATLKAAEDAGCDQVLTRGQFFANLESVVSGC